MKRVFISVVACWLGLCAGVFSQSATTKKVEIPPVPEGCVLDEASLFREHPEVLVEIQKSLKKLETDAGYPVYLAIYYNVYEADLQKRADALQDAWVGEGSNGMVLVYQLDPVTGANPASAYFEGSVLDRAENGEPVDGVIPGREVKAMLERSVEAAQGKREDHAEFISAVIFGIEREIIQYNKVETASWVDESNLKIMAVFLAAIAGLALAGLIVWRLFSKSDSRSSRAYFFPEVHVAQRLGAPFGGGWVSEATFVPVSSRK